MYFIYFHRPKSQWKLIGAQNINVCTSEYPHMYKTNFVVHTAGSERTAQLLIFLTFNKNGVIPNMRIFVSEMEC